MASAGKALIYVDTSLVVALLTPEEASARAIDWFAGSRDVLISSDWLITETHSALGLKRRLAGLSEEAWRTAIRQFDRLLRDGLELHGLDRARFRDAAELLQDVSMGLRAGDALHLASGRSLGETLAHQPGLTATYFGPAASRPVLCAVSCRCSAG